MGDTSLHGTSETRSWLTLWSPRCHFVLPFPSAPGKGTSSIYLTAQGTRSGRCRPPSLAEGIVFLWRSFAISRSCSCGGCSSEEFLETLALGLLQDPVFSFQYSNSHNCITFQSLPNCLIKTRNYYSQDMPSTRHSKQQLTGTSEIPRFGHTLSMSSASMTLSATFLGNCQPTQEVKQTGSQGQSLLHHQESMTRM